MSSTAILVLGHFVVSIFGFQLGPPVIQYIPYPSMEVCQQYAERQAGIFKISGEYSMVMRTQCVTEAEYLMWLQQQQMQQNQQPPENEGDK